MFQRLVHVACISAAYMQGRAGQPGLTSFNQQTLPLLPSLSVGGSESVPAMHLNFLQDALDAAGNYISVECFLFSPSFFCASYRAVCDTQ